MTQSKRTFLCLTVWIKWLPMLSSKHLLHILSYYFMRKIEICVYVLTCILWVCNPAKSFVIHCNLLNSGKSFAFQRHPSQSSTSRRYSSQHNAVLCKIKCYPLQSSTIFAIYHKPLQLLAIILNHELYIYPFTLCCNPLQYRALLSFAIHWNLELSFECNPLPE